MFDNKFDYNQAKYERVGCSLCGQDDSRPISNKDRYGLAVTTVICRNCGLIFINPRMSRADYDRFYQSAYRKQLEERRRVKIDWDNLFVKSTRLGQKLVGRIGNRLNSGLTLEVGSSCGGILNGLKTARPDLEILGLEPSSAEAGYANNRGIKTYISMFESFRESLPSLGNIFIVRSFNHLLDPAGFMTWSHHHLSPKGKLVIMVLDFVEACRRRGVLKTQVDHPYMFTQKTLANFVQSGGFGVEYSVTDGDYIYLVAKKENRPPFNQLETNPLYIDIKRSLNPWRLWWHYQVTKLGIKL